MRLLLICALLALTCCGYTVAGTGGDVQGRYYIEAMRNTSNDMTITRHIRQGITKFFLNYGALEERENAQYIMIITLADKTLYNAISSVTR